MSGPLGQGPIISGREIREAERRGREQYDKLRTMRDHDWRRMLPRKQVGLRHVIVAALPVAAFMLYVAWRLDYRDLPAVLFSMLVWVGLFAVVGQLLRAR